MLFKMSPNQQCSRLKLRSIMKFLVKFTEKCASSSIKDVLVKNVNNWTKYGFATMTLNRKDGQLSGNTPVKKNVLGQ